MEAYNSEDNNLPILLYNIKIKQTDIFPKKYDRRSKYTLWLWDR